MKKTLEIDSSEWIYSIKHENEESYIFFTSLSDDFECPLIKIKGFLVPLLKKVIDLKELSEDEMSKIQFLPFFKESKYALNSEYLKNLGKHQDIEIIEVNMENFSAYAQSELEEFNDYPYRMT